jgi:hypothetical protein
MEREMRLHRELTSARRWDKNVMHCDSITIVCIIHTGWHAQVAEKLPDWAERD